MIRRIKNQPHVHIRMVSHLCKISQEEVMDIILDPERRSITITRVYKKGVYIDATEWRCLLLDTFSSEVLRAWDEFMNYDGPKRRKLTQAERTEVASRQAWKCKSCKTTLTSVFEVDHIEEHCLRQNDSFANLQALCPLCHRQKTRRDQLFGNGLLEKITDAPPAPQKSEKPKKSDNVFAEYFCNKVWVRRDDGRRVLIEID